jgi:hypothetical protein
MNILIVGDSFAADWSQVDTDYCGWPQLLAKKHRVVNLAQAGCDEYRILKQLQSVKEMTEFDWIILCHTSPFRIHTIQHPVHKDSVIHKNADLIFADIEHHCDNNAHKTNQAVISARDFFLYHYDEKYYADIYELITEKIHSLIPKDRTLIADNFGQIDATQFPHRLNFTDIAEVRPGNINHFDQSGNEKICHAILDIIQQDEPILPDFKSVSTRLIERKYLAPDDVQTTDLDTSYPYSVNYSFNSRGYRDREWPDTFSELENCVWCIGDSATMGVGAPIEHSWPWLLEQKISQRTINISHRGVGNDYIYRKCSAVLRQIKPKYIVLAWSCLSRSSGTKLLDEQTIRNEFIENELQKNWHDFYKKIKSHDWPPCDNYKNLCKLPADVAQEISSKWQIPRIHWSDEVMAFGTMSGQDKHMLAQKINAKLTTEQIVSNFVELVCDLESQKAQTKLIHTIIPKFGTIEQTELVYLQLANKNIELYQQQYVDLARDRMHCDIKSNKLIVNNIVLQMKNV